MTTAAPWVELLTKAPLSDRRRLLEAQLVSAFRTWLHMTPSDAVPLDESYFALGLTSLGAVELQQHLEAQLGRRIESANLYNNPTVGHLSAYLRDDVLTDLFAQADRAAPASGDASVDNTARRIFDDLLSDLYDS
jgi:acyl carrier protein